MQLKRETNKLAITVDPNERVTAGAYLPDHRTFFSLKNGHCEHL